MEKLHFVDKIPLFIAHHLPFHYSYVMAAIASLLVVFGLPGATFAVGFFTNNFLNELGISRSAISLCWSLAMIITGLTQPFIGRAIDRFGAKKVLFVSTPVYFFAILWLSSKIESVFSLFFGFYLIRIGLSTAQGCGMYGCTQWWVVQRGAAMSFVNAFGTISLMGPALLLLIENAYGWRNTLIIEAVIMGIFINILTLFILDRPEKFGMLPDAVTVHPISSSSTEMVRLIPDVSLNSLENIEEKTDEKCEKDFYNKVVSNEVGFELQHTDEFENVSEVVEDEENPENVQENWREERQKEEEDEEEEEEEEEVGNVAMVQQDKKKIEIHWRWEDALRTGLFINVTLSMFFSTLLWSGFNFHYVEILSDRGFKSPTEFSYLYPVSALAGVVVTLMSGPLVDRLTVKSYAIVLGQIFAVLSATDLLILSWYPSHTIFVILFGIFFGSMDGIMTVGYLTIFADIFGRVDIATISAVATFVSTLSVGLGSFLFAYSRENLESFDPVLLLIVIGSTTFSIGIILAGNPIPPDPSRLLSL
jgi:MFS family permease